MFYWCYEIYMFLSNKSHNNHGIDNKYRAADITILKISL